MESKVANIKTAPMMSEILSPENLSCGLEILVHLAEKGEIDPWDIDIIDVTDKYLKALNKSPRENLLNAGRAIFFASVLLRLKSEILLNISNETLIASQQTENFFPEDELLLDQETVRLDLAKLESFISRSSLGRQQRKRKISLSDLISALQEAEEEQERREIRVKLRADRAFTIIPPETPTDLLEIAHEEDIEEIVEKIEAVIEEHLTDDNPVRFSFLCDILNNKVKPFLALLFLAHSQRVVLEQKDIYGEIFVHKWGTLLKEEEAVQVEKKERKKTKKGLIEKIKEKITKQKKRTDGLESLVINAESEVLADGNSSTVG